MATVQDVAAYILGVCGSMTAMKLQKLAYYSHAWHLVWEERPLFDSRIEAWANGPVIPELYRGHRGRLTVSSWPGGDSDALDAGELSSIDAVLEFYGEMTAHELSELTHRELPWLEARRGLSAGERSNREITDAAIHEYYDGLTSSGS